MTKKPAPTKAKEPKASPDARASAPTPAPSIEPKPDRFSNPLLTDPAIHPDLKPLFDAMVLVSALSSAIDRCYHDMLVLKESRGLPAADEWPDSPALEQARAQHAEWVQAMREEYAAKGKSVVVADFLESRWTELMREWRGYYRDWCDAIAKTKELAQSPAVAAIMDAGESRPAHRWTTQTIVVLDNLAGTMHPINVGGVDGLGFIRCGLPPLPQDFRTNAEAVGKRIGELRAVPAVDDLIDRLAVASPPPILSDDELARLRAHLKAPLRLSAMKDEAERDRWRTLREVLNYNDELRADARGTPAPRRGATPKATRRERRAKWLAEAMLTVRDHPEWSDATIAERVGIDKSRLSRSPEYRAAASMVRTPKTPAGSVRIANGDRELEAVDDSFDPNRPASRQWQDEEDTDDRIDREIIETQRKPQRGAVKTPTNRRSGGA
jgi:hypothetical protein